MVPLAEGTSAEPDYLVSLGVNPFVLGTLVAVFGSAIAVWAVLTMERVQAIKLHEACEKKEQRVREAHGWLSQHAAAMAFFPLPRILVIFLWLGPLLALLLFLQHNHWV